MSKEFSWRANYSDNTFLRQGKNAYENIDRSKLESFDILNENEDVIFRLHLEPGRKLIYRKRNKIDIQTGKVYSYFFMVGWHQNINGVNTQSINYIFPEREIETGAGDKKIIPVQVISAGRWDGGPPTLREEEQVANKL